MKQTMGFSVLVVAVALNLGFANKAQAQEVFSSMSDVLVNRCFSAPLSVQDQNELSIGIESGFIISGFSRLDKGCAAGTYSGLARVTSDTFNVMISAPAGMKIARIHYHQSGYRFIERSTFWFANGSLGIKVNGNQMSNRNFQSPVLIQTVELSSLNLSSADVSISLSLSTGRNSSNSRVTSAPGGAHYRVENALIEVEYE